MATTSHMYWELATGYKMPMLGLGTYLMTDKKVIWKVLEEALSIGYRLIDTSSMYGNEREIGTALRKLLPKHNLTRQDVFVISKLPPTHHGDAAYECIKDSLRMLQLEYFDLYLIHWPGSCDCDPRDPINEILREKSWAALVRAKQDGLIRSLGVSNYSVRHLSGLLANCFGERPTVNQIEWHPRWHKEDMKELCAREGILIQAYFSFGGSEKRYLLRDSSVISLAEKIGKSTPQVLLQWSLQQQVAVIPKASLSSHLKANIVGLDFAIPEEYMKELSNLSQIRYGSDPEAVF